MNTYLVIAIILGVILLLAIFIILYYYEVLQRVKKRNIDLSVKNTSLEMHRLKFALQPHTLNNVLANLKAMSNQISQSMESLSETLEYIFYHGDDHLVSVEEEVQFIKSYVDLQDIFTTSIDSIELDTSGINTSLMSYSKKAIPHLITAYLIENAFKHGDIHHPDFLKVKIELSEKKFSIRVQNKIRKNYTPRSTGTGLKNMLERLKILKEGKYTFETEKLGEEFIAHMTIKIA